MRKRTAAKRWVAAMGGALVASMLLAASLGADDAKQTTYLTFSGPVQIPGVTLPAGTYIFERVDPNMDADVIHVLSRNRSTVFAMMRTSRVERRNPGSRVAFWETAPGTAPAIRVWYPHGGRLGHEFKYSRTQARQLASLD